MRGQTAKREVGEKGVGIGRREGGGRCEKEGREGGEEKFVKWEKSDPPNNKNVNK
jgi:hypothetical protein